MRKLLKIKSNGTTKLVIYFILTNHLGADSQIRFIDVQFILIKASTDRVSDRGCAILFDQC